MKRKNLPRLWCALQGLLPLWPGPAAHAAKRAGPGWAAGKSHCGEPASPGRSEECRCLKPK